MLGCTFWNYVEKTISDEDCWLWRGFVRKDGYGKAWFNGKIYKAHRASYEIHYGEIPKGFLICHKCDVRHCVNPNHLFVGTYLDNMKDASQKGRTAKGAKNGLHAQKMVKLDEDQVRYIIEMRGKVEQKDLAKEFSVSKPYISQIQRGLRWNHVCEIKEVTNVRCPRKPFKLSLEKVLEIKKLKGKMRVKDLAEKYGISISWVYIIQNKDI